MTDSASIRTAASRPVRQPPFLSTKPTPSLSKRRKLLRCYASASPNGAVANLTPSPPSPQEWRGGRGRTANGVEPSSNWQTKVQDKRAAVGSPCPYAGRGGKAGVRSANSEPTQVDVVSLITVSIES